MKTERPGPPASYSKFQTYVPVGGTQMLLAFGLNCVILPAQEPVILFVFVPLPVPPKLPLLYDYGKQKSQ